MNFLFILLMLNQLILQNCDSEKICHFTCLTCDGDGENNCKDCSEFREFSDGICKC